MTEKNTMSEQSPYDAGYDSFPGEVKNPHPSDSDEWRDWAAGRLDAAFAAAATAWNITAPEENA
ncbi:hypothetical protein LCGC14_0643360 [marine sediment metagenome]|uniref:Uncharacterized protein n=1 Tax=marine sediment metagenome TaxID=412755 RepID=A0A0F9QYK7_9ZZZZ